MLIAWDCAADRLMDDMVAAVVGEWGPQQAHILTSQETGKEAEEAASRKRARHPPMHPALGLLGLALGQPLQRPHTLPPLRQ